MIFSILKSMIIKVKNPSHIKMKLYKKVSLLATIKAKKGKITIGKGLVLSRYATIAAVNGGKIVIGNNVSCNQNCICAAHKKIEIKDNTSIGPNVCIYDHDHKFNENGKISGFSKKDIIIEENVWIGAGSIILKGSHIGKNSVIGAGCIVKGEIPENSLVTQNRELTITKLEAKNKK